MKNINDKNKSAPSYYERPRPDVISVIPPDAKTVLSIGCASGKTEAELVKTGKKVVGVELNHEAAQRARERGVIVLEGDAAKIDINLAGEDLYDCIIYSDILEHLPDPVSVLKRHVQMLKTNGIVYISVPNFRHYSIFWQLFILGRIKYRDAGVLDRGHIRITSRKMVMDWLNMAGLVLDNYHYAIPGRKNRLISACLLGFAREFMAAQIGLVARKPK